MVIMDHTWILTWLSSCINMPPVVGPEVWKCSGNACGGSVLCPHAPSSLLSATELDDRARTLGEMLQFEQEADFLPGEDAEVGCPSACGTSHD